jgi:hypothetical protein
MTRQRAHIKKTEAGDKHRVNYYYATTKYVKILCSITACPAIAMDHRRSADDLGSHLFHTQVYRVKYYPLSARGFSTSAKPSSSSAAR